MFYWRIISVNEITNIPNANFNKKYAKKFNIIVFNQLNVHLTSIIII